MKITCRVRDGYAFIGRTRSPDLAGSVIEVTAAEAVGQEHKLERLSAVRLECVNSSCKKTYETTVFDLGRAFCPHCGGKGGKLLTLPAPPPPPPLLLAIEAAEVATPVEVITNREEKGQQRGRRKRGK